MLFVATLVHEGIATFVSKLAGDDISRHLDVVVFNIFMQLQLFIFVISPDVDYDACIGTPRGYIVLYRYGYAVRCTVFRYSQCGVKRVGWSGGDWVMGVGRGLKASGAAGI